MTTRRRIAESTRSTISDDEEEEEDDEEMLEEVVSEMANKVKEYRSSLPPQLKSSLSSLLSSFRPTLSLSSDVSLRGPGSESCSGESNKDTVVGDGERNPEDVKLLNEKISSNISAMSKVLKRMNDCISRIDTLVSSDQTIHPTFKRKKG